MKMLKHMYVGGYKGQNPHCLYACSYDENGQISTLASYEIDNASYLCFSPNRQYLYAVIEQEGYKGRSGGGIAAFAVEKDGQLRFINDSFTEGVAPCHLSVSDDGQTLYAANYTGGSTIFFDLLPTGGIGPKRVLVDHRIFGQVSQVVAGRQEAPHAHYIHPVLAHGVPTIWVCDLGLDAVLVLDKTGKELTRFVAPAGFGPRHLAFHPVLPIAYVLGELSCSVIAMEYDCKKTVSIHAYPEVSVLKPGAKSGTCAAIRVSPDCKHLLVSNRVPEEEGSISILGLEAGHVRNLENVVPSGGCCPRDFAFSLDGDNVFVANQDSDNITIFGWNKGMLTPTGVAMDIQKPTCVLL